ncbi:conjugative transfer signal peptidase TraF [Luteimonas sp. BDR2-5]|uniref:conjugative transfer signal peptidase TraF n=1 Tax=Proluteimonas luteida TaxID=2878685 RepID=UPI001E3A6E4C|nr:conjugative transfer signal peptidase TraF [Luteimonas sp. BDR2-5]MCD9026714.1 conjugative transfer signal peptidase TraF [Luteimonas sp. BDR2-5]
MASLPAHPPLRLPRWAARSWDSLRDFLVHARRRWYLYLPLLLIWALAYIRVFLAPTPQVPVLFNVTPSLPYHIALLRPSSAAPERGSYILYRFDGDAVTRYPGLRGQPIFKQVAGLPGDVVTVDGRRVSINGVPVGDAKPRAFDGWPLATIAPTVIPEGHYFVSGSGPDSFDSRYGASGLVRRDQIVGRVEPWF